MLMFAEWLQGRDVLQSLRAWRGDCAIGKVSSTTAVHQPKLVIQTAGNWSKNKLIFERCSPFVARSRFSPRVNDIAAYSKKCRRCKAEEIQNTGKGCEGEQMVELAV